MRIAKPRDRDMSDVSEGRMRRGSGISGEGKVGGMSGREIPCVISTLYTATEGPGL